MADLDDPFDRDTQGHNNMRFQLRTRYQTTPLSTTHKAVGGAINTHVGQSGNSQATLSDPNTGFRLSRALLDDPNLSDLHKKRLRRQDYGANFFTKRLYLSELPDGVDYSGSYAGLTDWMHGYRWPCSQAFAKSQMNWENALGAVEVSNISELRSWGTDGIAKTLPTVPEASVVTAIGELGRGLPKIPAFNRLKNRDGRKPTLGEASDEFLNYTFGIMPTVSDVTTIATTAVDAERILAQYRRDANRLVRRRILLHDSSNTTTSTHRATEYPFGHLRIDPLKNAIGNCTHEVTTSKRVWFSGGYQYDLPPVESQLGKLAEFNRLYGVIPTPEDLWNLTAWSWLTDWYANTGKVLSNLSTLSRDGVRIHHAYVMMEIKREYKYSNFKNSVSFTEVSKNRMRASPFGFGRRPASLSNKEKTILTALGISRWSS